MNTKTPRSLVAAVSLLDPVRASNGSRDVESVLRLPTSVLIGVSTKAADVLAQIDIVTVFDLATSELFNRALNISLLAEHGEGSFAFIGKVPRDAVRDGSTMSLTELAAAPISQLASRFPVAKLDELAQTLDLETIRDLAAWPPYRASCDLLNRMYDPTPSYEVGSIDSGTPLDLLPATGQYPTERVQYEVLLFDSFVDDGGPTAQPLVNAGQLDLSKLGTVPEGYARPAIGGVLTYTQSWFTKGLSLGHLIHGVALGPGETTRIAVIDWARQVRTAAVESIEEMELLVAELSHSRSIGEITSAVARETQRGRSAANSASSALQYGESSSGANLRDFNPFENPTAFTGLSVISPGVETFGSSLGIATNTSGAVSWSTTSGRRDVGAMLAQDIVDRTHQQAHSARNRRASIVREVSQQEAETISTRTLTNYNHMHSLTIEYYEVVQLYRTVVELTKAERCVFVPMKLLDFRDLTVIDRYRVALMAASLSPVMTEALALPAKTIPLRAPAVLSSELQAGDLTTNGVGSLADDKWLARDINAAFAATGGQIRVMADGRLALPSDAVLSGVELYTGPRAGGDTLSGGMTSRRMLSSGISSGEFFVGSRVIPVSASAETKPGLRIQKGSRVRVVATGQVTFGTDVEPEDRFFSGPSNQLVLGTEIKDTGLKIQRGSQIHMLAGGAVNYQTYPGDAQSWSPDGTRAPAGAGFYQSRLWRASLICRIGSTWEQGGVDTAFTARDDGNLILQPNDVIGGLGPGSNNSGWWDVQLEVTAPAGTPTVDTFNADGFTGPAAGSNYYAPNARKFSLICQIGTTWHQGGTNTEFTAEEDGELMLQPNDLVGDLENNTGGWQVTLTVTAPEPDTLAPTITAQPSLSVSKRAGAPVTVTRGADEQWPIDTIRLRLEEIESMSLTTPGARANDVGFLALSFTVRSRDFRIAVPVKLRAAGAATVFHADVPADLVSHLLDHRLYYSQAVWRSLDPATIGVLLSGFTWRLDGQTRRLAEIVDPAPVAVVANYLVLRLSGDTEEEYNAWLGRARITVGQIREDQVPIPTGGVFAEAVLGRANSAEKLDITRFWDWQESPIPFQAPEIAPVQPGSRRDVDTTTPGQLGQPVLNIVNPPSLPDPTGMSAVLAAIQNGNMFRDMSGLAGTIGLAQAAVTETGRAATEAAKQAGADAATAAQLGAKVAEIAGEVFKAYLTKGGSLLGGGGGAKAGLIQTPGGNSKTGSMLNYGKEMDQRGVPPPSGGTGLPSGPGANGTAPSGTTPPGGGGTAWPENMASAPSWESNAMDAALGNSNPGGGTLDPGIVLASANDPFNNPRPIATGLAARQRAGVMLMNPKQIRWPQGKQIVPGDIHWGNTLIVDADEFSVYYMREDTLYIMGTEAFRRDGPISAYLAAVAGAEPLATIATAEIAFLAGLFVSPFFVAAAHAVDLGLKARANKDKIELARTAVGNLISVRQCLKLEAPDMLADLERTAVFEIFRELPSTITVEQAAFWVGRILAGLLKGSAGGAQVTIGAVVRVIIAVTAKLAILDGVINSPTALAQAIEDEAPDLVSDLRMNNVNAGTTQAKAWMRLLIKNPQARQCFESLKESAEELLQYLQTLQPEILG